MQEYSYRRLNVYKNAKQLVLDVYKLLHKFPKVEMYALCDQLRRAIVSVPSNVAEGLSRTSEKEKIHFLEIAYGSLMEVQCQLDIAKDLGYITAEEFDLVDKAISEEGCIISGMRRILSQKLTTNTNN